MTENITGLLGWPVDHSLSPAIHGYWLKKYAIEGSYELFPAEPEKLAEKVASLRSAKGFNVTVPHKQAVIPHIDAVDKLARRIGAVNTVVNVGGHLLGTNTDAYGFIVNLEEGAGDLKPYFSHAVVLGAGGAARAAVLALKEAKFERITIINRTEAAAQGLAKEFDAEWAPWENKNALANARLLVNTTSLGMTGKEKLDIRLDALPADALVHDIVYAPRETELLKAAKARGNKTVDGLGMLLHQAAAAFRIWHEIAPEVTPELRALLEAK